MHFVGLLDGETDRGNPYVLAMKNQRAGNSPNVPLGDHPFIPITGDELIPLGDLNKDDIPLLPNLRCIPLQQVLDYL